MSGIEIAGLALGAFPLILEALKVLGKGIDKYRHIRDIRHELSFWTYTVKTESLCFKSTFRRLLILSKIESPGPRLNALVQNSDPQKGIWQTPENDWLLKCYLEDSYDVFIECVTKLRLSLIDVQKKLRIQDRLPDGSVRT